MDMSYCSPLQPQENHSSFLFDCSVPLDPLAFDPSLDPGYFSTCSSLSPSSSVDSFSFSPNSLQVKTEQHPQDCFMFSNIPQLTASTIKILPQHASTACVAKKSRSRYPGKKRQTASEREKLRMRDLTKALHYLRSFLPASVAPEGQALTKIETLRLTIRYITQLSTQLGITEESLEKRRTSGRVKQGIIFIPLQENAHPGACPGAYTSPLMVSTGLRSTTQPCWVPQQQYPNTEFNGQY